VALAGAGLGVVGPMELFFPSAAAARFGSFVWIMLLALYAMGVVLVALMLRPRLVIYNVSADALRPILAELVDSLDPDARWAGDSLVLPGLNVQLFIDHFATLRCASLSSAGANQSHAGWRRLEAALGHALAREDMARSPRGLLLLAAGMAICAALATSIAQNPDATVQSLLNIANTLRNLLGL